MFDRRRGTKHAPQALAFFIEKDRRPRVVVANLDSAPSVFFHTNLLGSQIFAKHTYAVNSPSGLKSWPMPADLMGWTRGFPPNYALVERNNGLFLQCKTRTKCLFMAQRDILRRCGIYRGTADMAGLAAGSTRSRLTHMRHWRLPTEFARCGFLPLPEAADLWSDGLPRKRRELSLPLG